MEIIFNAAKTYNLATVKMSKKNPDALLINSPSLPTPIDLMMADKINISAIFSWDLPRLRSVADNALFFGCKVLIGGPAVANNIKSLSKYNIGYDHGAEYVEGDFSMTWTSRGCIRNCSWCIVPKIEGRTMIERDNLHYAPLVLDNNFLACSDKHIEKVLTLWSGKKVDFNQGLDARLYTPQFREQIEYYNIRPTVWRFAYDTGGVGRYVQKAIKDLTKSGVRHERIRIYLLFNHMEPPNEARERAEEIISWGASPFPMAYRPLDWEKEDYYTSPHWSREQIIDFRRFFSRAQLWRSMEFDNYKPRKTVKAA
jgi:hypothetical protein